MPAALAELVIARAAGCCDRCGGPVDGWDGYSLHHRDPRGMGGRKGAHTAANVVLLCGSGTTGCHGWVEGNRTAAEAEKWLIRGTVARPETTPVFRHGREWVLPTEEGWAPAEPLAA